MALPHDLQLSAKPLWIKVVIEWSKTATQVAEKSVLFPFPLYLISAVYQLKMLNKVKQFIFF